MNADLYFARGMVGYSGGVNWCLGSFKYNNLQHRGGGKQDFLPDFSVQKIPGDSSEFGIMPWSRCHSKTSITSKMVPFNFSKSRSRPVQVLKSRSRANSSRKIQENPVISVSYPVQTREICDILHISLFIRTFPVAS